jgi:hypothetical protein
MPMQKISTLTKKSTKRTYLNTNEIGLEPNKIVLKNILAFSNSTEGKKGLSGQSILISLN